LVSQGGSSGAGRQRGDSAGHWRRPADEDERAAATEEALAEGRGGDQAQRSPPVTGCGGVAKGRRGIRVAVHQRRHGGPAMEGGVSRGGGLLSSSRGPQWNRAADARTWAADKVGSGRGEDVGRY
jgi:hypothetical protein